MCMNGEWVGALYGQPYDDLNPYTGEVFARVPAGFGGRAGLEEFTELRWISMQLTPREYPF
jgi:benzaldehyde dehydrogenase (NAD)